LFLFLMLAALQRAPAQDEKRLALTSKTVAEWIVALHDENRPELHDPACRALGPEGPYAKEAIPALIEDLIKQYPHTMSPAAEILADHGQSAVPSLLRALKRPERRFARARQARSVKSGRNRPRSSPASARR
jgi:hypothetical protein